MKNIISAMLLAGFSFCNAQIIIGDAAGIASNKTSVLLEFADQNKGLILPYVRTIPALPTEGTIVLDASTTTAARIKYYNANTTSGTDGWIDLSGQNADLTTVLTTQPSGVDESASKTVIGALSSSADGVLVLESNDKAMILPTVEDVQNIPSPSPGMIVYVKKTGAKRLAVFNGSKWSFWRP